MPLTFKEIKAWRDKERERLPDIKNNQEREITVNIINTLTAVLQDDWRNDWMPKQFVKRNECITCGNPCTNKQCRSCFESHKKAWQFRRYKRLKYQLRIIWLRRMGYERYNNLLWFWYKSHSFHISCSHASISSKETPTHDGLNILYSYSSLHTLVF